MIAMTTIKLKVYAITINIAATWMDFGISRAPNDPAVQRLPAARRGCK
jgi:hypothetical protein